MSTWHQLVIGWAATSLLITGAVTAAALRSAARLSALPRPTSRRDLRSQHSAALAAAGRHAGGKSLRRLTAAALALGLIEPWDAARTVPAGRRIPAQRAPTTYAATLPAELLRAELDHVLGCTIRCTTTRQEAPTMTELVNAPVRRIRAAVEAANTADFAEPNRHVHTQWEVICLEDPPLAFLFEGATAERDAFDLFESDHVRTSSATWKIRTRTVLTVVQHTPWQEAGTISGQDVTCSHGYADGTCLIAECPSGTEV